MVKSNKISIIMCAYNTEKYISHAIESILAQTYSNFELIVVDDCSTDNTLKIIEKFVLKDSRIICLKNHKNMGAAYSRNKALKSVTGYYVGFVDSDDFLESNYYEVLINSIKDADICVCDIKSIYEFKNNEYTISKCCIGECNKLNVINNGLASSSCNKLFKKDIILKYEYPVGYINEDVAVVIPCLANAKQINYTDETFYNYIQRSSSVQNSLSIKKFDIFDMVNLCFERMDCNDKIVDAVIFNQIILLLIYIISEDNSFSERYKYLNIYSKKVQGYNILNNKYFVDFLNGLGNYHRKYYKMLVSLNYHHLNLLANLLVGLYHFYRKYMIKNVIKKNIDINDLIGMAKYQNRLSIKDKTISVIIPNYNYSEFLYQRLYSVLYQNYKINEIIILDDCSNDNSRDVIDDLVLKLKPYINIKKEYNKINSGSAFAQWHKGFSLAKSKYVWIAEADDYCSNLFLKQVMNSVTADVVLAYSNTSFIDTNGKIIYKNVVPDIDIMKTGHWNSNYINNGIDEIKSYAYLNCTISNVSSVVFKNDNYEKEFSLSSKYKQAGDWLFYINIMRKGDISYVNRTLNYYRVHGNNVTSTTKKENHFKEIKNIHSYIDNLFKFNRNQKFEIAKRYKYLFKMWNLKDEEKK